MEQIRKKRANAEHNHIIAEDLQTLGQGEAISCDNGTVLACVFSVEDSMWILQNVKEGEIE